MQWSTKARLGTGLAAGILLWGLPVFVMGLIPNAPLALGLLAVVGIGNTLLDVAGYTLLQRVVPDEVLGRVFGGLETVILVSIAAGSLAAPLLAAGVGIRGAVVVAGLILPLVAAATWHWLRRVDARAVESEPLRLLREIPLTRALAPPTLEGLASAAVRLSIAPGATICSEGEPADRFYLISSGEVVVTIGDEEQRRLRAGDSFGEIGLLRRVPRTATVTAPEGAELYALDRETFVAAVTGHPESAATADAVIAERLGSLRSNLAAL